MEEDPTNETNDAAAVDAVIARLVPSASCFFFFASSITSEMISPRWTTESSCLLLDSSD
eukprot:CAMPEP_0118715140 /NCGR_PEP_ID=MMETSP0800-20121206/26683_1 /TAXON_ID=210618 ORGANISM="Striatella unipunctata, Strain CCMP2910" /NCGR_SAMPLE_ID=MMETSP0800 /ASSEMBLY_ACC=CAM_ASM_000638 /LENGTH=58 /DNA_ID=CAMNT_0006621223 /DNA_START=118 /DNA_END=291 /DNA_ORIENTATION=+